MPEALTLLEQIFPWLVPMLPLAGIIFFVVYRKRRPTVEQAFLIYQDGALLAHTTSRLVADMDSDIFSSMLTAIQEFAKDSFKDEKETGLKMLKFGEKEIIIERGKSGLVSIALVYTGGDAGLSKKAEKILAEVESEFGAVLKGWNGNMHSVRGVKDIMARHLSKG